MADEPETFLRRWARLKARRAKPPAPEPTPAVLSEPTKVEPEGEATAPEPLPPIEELTKDSDFTPFLRAGVPEELKRLALRKLWRSDPVLANLDGLVEYGEDFGAPFRNPGPVSTLFRLGRGMPGPGSPNDDEEAEAKDVAETDTARQGPGESPAPPSGAGVEAAETEDSAVEDPTPPEDDQTGAG